MKLKTIREKYWNEQIRNNLISGVLVAIVLALISQGVSHFIDSWPGIIEMVTSIPAYLVSDITMPVWLIIVAILLLFISKRVSSIRGITKHPDYINYTGDNIFDIDWFWQWGFPYKNRSNYEIVNLTGRCPECKTRISYNSYVHKFVFCENIICTWEWPDHYSGDNHVAGLFSSERDLIKSVENEIDRKLHTDEWRSG